MTKERDDYKRSFDAMPDKGEKGMGCTLVDAILCHLDVFVDTDERFWELARIADAGHTRQIQHIVMRAFIRMVDEADRADAATKLLVEILKMQRARYGDGMRTHLALMDFADKIEALLTETS